MSHICKMTGMEAVLPSAPPRRSVPPTAIVHLPMPNPSRAPRWNSAPKQTLNTSAR